MADFRGEPWSAQELIDHAALVLDALAEGGADESAVRELGAVLDALTGTLAAEREGARGC